MFTTIFQIKFSYKIMVCCFKGDSSNNTVVRGIDYESLATCLGDFESCQGLWIFYVRKPSSQLQNAGGSTSLPAYVLSNTRRNTRGISSPVKAGIVAV